MALVIFTISPYRPSLSTTVCPTTNLNFIVVLWCQIFSTGQFKRRGHLIRGSPERISRPDGTRDGSKMVCNADSTSEVAIHSPRDFAGEWRGARRLNRARPSVPERWRDWYRRS